MATESFIKNILHGFEVADEKVAFDVYDGASVSHITYRQFLSDILIYTGYFVENKIKHQHIALVAPNSYEWVVAFYAICASGNAVVPMDSEANDEILIQQMMQSDISLICCDTALTEKIFSKKTQLPIVKFSDLSRAYPILSNEVICVDKYETILLLLTSGTTGKNKVVEFSAFNVESSIKGHSFIFDAAEHQRVMASILPMYHIAGIMSYVLLPQYKHWTVCIGRGAKYMLVDLPVLNPTHICVVPEVLSSIVKVLKKEIILDRKLLENSLKNIHFFVGAAVLPIEDVLFLHSRGIRLNIAYALTETCGAGLSCNIDINCPQAIGKPNKNVQCCIQDGEILLKSDAVMKGYYKDPEETARVVRDGWLHTGDLGYCDECGNYYFTGRKKNTIILSNGENVNPEEIEADWSRCEAIEECLVYADEKGICADVYVSNQDQASRFIKDYNERIPRCHQVYKVFYSDRPLEKTSSGKLKRKGNKA